MLKPRSLRPTTLLNNSIGSTMNGNALYKDYVPLGLAETQQNCFSLASLGGYINRALLYGDMRGWTDRERMSDLRSKASTEMSA